MSQLDPTTMMEEKSSTNIDLTKKVKPGSTPVVEGDPPKSTGNPNITPEVSGRSETDAQENMIARATWSRDQNLAKLDKYLGLDKGSNFGVRKGLNPMYVDTRDVKNTKFQMGEAQSNWAKSGDALVRFSSDAVGTFIKEFSYLADIENHISGGSDPSNWLADFITPIQESISKEFEIFRDNDESVKMWGDWGWWTEGLAQMGTTAGMLGAMLVTRGVGGAGARLASALSNAKKIEGSASFLTKLQKAYKAAGHAVPRGMASDFGYAVLSRAGESAMEADDTYRSIKEELMSQGISEEIAEAKAKEAASEVYKGNWLMLGQDILQQRMFSGLLGKNSFFGGSAKKVAEKATEGGIWAKAGRALTSGYGLGKDMITEGMEEAYQYYVQEQARNKALVSTGLKSGPEYKAFSDFLNDGEMWNSAIWGAFGSAFMAGTMKAVGMLEQRRANIQKDPNIDEYTKSIQLKQIDDEIYAKKAQMIQPVQVKDYYDQVADAAKMNNPRAVNNIIQRMAATSAINDVIAGVEEGGAFTKAEFANDPKGALESLMEDAIKLDEQSAEMLKEKGKEYLDTYNKAKELFKANKEKYEDNYVAQAFTLTQMEHTLAKKELAEINTSIDQGYSELSKDFSEETNSVSTQVRQQLELEANQNFLTQVDKIIDIYKESTQAAETVAGLEKAKKEAKKTVDALTKSLEEFTKDEATTPEQKEALKTQGINLLKNTDLGQALLNLMTTKNFQKATEFTAAEALRTASKQKFEKLKKEVEAIEKKVRENKEKDTATTAEGETIKNPTSTKNDTVNDEETLTDDEVVNDEDLNIEDNESNYNTAKDNFIGEDLNEETKLKTVNGVAWRSSNQELTSTEDTATFQNNEQESLEGDAINREGVTKFFESKSLDLNNYYVKYEVDTERIDGNSIIGEKQLKAINEGTEVPSIGLLPVKMTIFNKSDNSPVTYQGKQLTIWVHNANPVKDTMSHLSGLRDHTKLEYAEKRNHHYHSDVMESAIEETTATKKKVVEASRAGKELTGSLKKVSNGHVVFSENEPISDPKFGITPDLKFGVGNGVAIKSGKTSTSIGTKSPRSGVIYVQMPTGGWMPVKTRKVNQEEAGLILDLYKEVLAVLAQGGNSKEVTPSTELLAKLNGSGILKYMPKDASLIDYLNTLVYQGSKTKGDRMLQAFIDNKTKRPLLAIGGTLFNNSDLQEDSKERDNALKLLMDKKLRNVEFTRLEDTSYKKAIIQFLTADVTTTPEGNLFVQPTIAHTMEDVKQKEAPYKAEEGFSAFTTNEGLYYINDTNQVVDSSGNTVTNPTIINKVRIAKEQSQGTTETTPGYIKLEDGTIIETKGYNTVIDEAIINEVEVALDKTEVIDIEAKKADIERRKKEDNKKIGVSVRDREVAINRNKLYKINLEGENREVTQKEYDKFNRVLDSYIKDGLTAQEIFEAFRIGKDDGYTYSSMVNASNFLEYIQDRIDGKTDLKLGENILEKINAKYDAELAALEAQEATTEEITQFHDNIEVDDIKKIYLTSLINQIVLYQNKPYKVINEGGGKISLESGNLIIEVDSTKSIEELGIEQPQISEKYSKYKVSDFISSETGQELVTINGVEYIINTNTLGNAESLSPINKPSQKIKNEAMLIALDIERNKQVIAILNTLSEETVNEIYEEANSDNFEVLILENAYNKNLSETVTSGLNKLYQNENLSENEILAVDLWVTNALIDVSKLLIKNPNSEIYQKSIDTLELINVLLYENFNEEQIQEFISKKTSTTNITSKPIANTTRQKEKIKSGTIQTTTEQTETTESRVVKEQPSLFNEDGTINDEAYETVDGKSLFGIDSTTEVAEDFPVEEATPVIEDINVATVEVEKAAEETVVEKEVPVEKTSKRRPLKKIKGRTNIVESGIGNTEKSSNIVKIKSSELDEEGKEINDNCFHQNKKK